MAKSKPAETPNDSLTLWFQCANVMDTKTGENDAKRSHLFPVTGDPTDGTENPNKAISQGAPSATFEVLVDQPGALDFFQSGAQYDIIIRKR